MSGRVNRGDQINWNQVFYFSEIAASGSVKAAAEKLSLSPSTLSEHLSQLESDLNLKLFDRQHRKLQLTHEGARLYTSARQMFESGKRFIDILSPKPIGCYPVSIGIVPGSSYSFAHATLQKLLGGDWDVSARILQFQHEDMEAAILEAKLDFGFTDQRSERRNIAQSLVETSELDFFVSHPIERNELPELLKEHPLIICRSERRGPSPVEEILESLDMPPSRVIYSEYPSLVESLCREGVGIALLGRRHFENDARVCLLPSPKNFPRLSEKLFVSWHADAENSVAIDRLKRSLGQGLS